MSKHIYSIKVLGKNPQKVNIKITNCSTYRILEYSEGEVIL
jgi:hypothetical protein